MAFTISGLFSISVADVFSQTALLDIHYLIAAYDSVYQRLIANVSLSDVTSSFAMEQIKYTTALPLTYAK